MAYDSIDDERTYDTKPYPNFDDDGTTYGEQPAYRRKRQGRDGSIARTYPSGDPEIGAVSGLNIPSDYGPRGVQPETTLPDNYSAEGNERNPDKGAMRLAGAASRTPNRYEAGVDRALQTIDNNNLDLAELQRGRAASIANYQPSGVRKLFATLGGIGTGLLTANPVIGYMAGRTIANAPLQDKLQRYDEQSQDLAEQNKQLQSASGLRETMLQRQNEAAKTANEVQRTQDEAREVMAIPGVEGPEGTSGTRIIPKMPGAPGAIPFPGVSGPTSTPSGVGAPSGQVSQAGSTATGMQQGAPNMPADPYFFPQEANKTSISVTALTPEAKTFLGKDYSEEAGADILADTKGNWTTRDGRKIPPEIAAGMKQINAESRGSMRPKVNYASEAEGGKPNSVTVGMKNYPIGPDDKAYDPDNANREVSVAVQNEANVAIANWKAGQAQKAQTKADDEARKTENEKKLIDYRASVSKQQKEFEDQLRNSDLTQEDKNRVAAAKLNKVLVDRVNKLVQANPDIIGPVWGRMESYSQGAGTSFGLQTPQKETAAAELAAALNDLFVGELKTTTGASRVAREIIQERLKTSPKLFNDKAQFSGFINNIIAKSNETLNIFPQATRGGGGPAAGGAGPSSPNEVSVTMKDGTVHVYDSKTKKYLRTEGK